MKRTISLILAFLLLMSILAGCGSGDDTSASSLTISDLGKAFNTSFERQEIEGKIEFSNAKITGLATKKERIISLEYSIANKNSVRTYYNDLYSISRFKAEMQLYNQLPYDWLTFNLNFMSCVPFLRFIAGESENTDEFFGLEQVIDAKKSSQSLNGWKLKTYLSDDNTITISATYEGS